MHRPKLTDHQAVMMLELCLDAEERCDQRIAAARAQGGFSVAAYEVQLKEQYENMRARILEEMKYNGVCTQALHSMLQQVSHSAEKYRRSANALDAELGEAGAA